MEKRIVKSLLVLMLVASTAQFASAAYLDMADEYFKAGDSLKAIEAYELAINNNEDKEKAYVGLANVYARDCDYTKARNLLVDALAINPKSLDALLSMAVIYGEIGWTYDDVASYKKGLEYLKQAKEYHPEQADKIDSVINEFNTKITEFPQEQIQTQERSEIQKLLEVSDKTYSYKISKAIESGDFGTGLKLCDEAIAQHEELDVVYMLKAAICTVTGDTTQALALVNKSIEINPKSVKSITLRAAILGEEGKYSEAIADYNKAIEIDPQNPDLYMKRANLRYANGDNVGAEADLRKVEELFNGIMDIQILQ